jgi:EAL domain-containing protein (putative c-di-GMP-specific phosphodiesterase class I)/AmiR/NasT family two-component response regulator
MHEFEKIEILLAEDNDADAEMTIRALRRNNLANHLVRVKHGAEALDFIFRRGAYAQRSEGAPKLILLDVKMPEVDGIEVLRQIKSNEATRTIPVVMLDSSAEERDIVASYSLGVNCYIVKPVDFASFADEVTRAGCYWVLYSSDMNSDLGERLTLETDLWKAVERNELVLYYQPRVELKSGRIIGMEALLRWRHSTKGLIPPAIFIPVAEASSLITEIGSWVIHEACTNNKAWQDANLRSVPIAVNISARQLHDRDLVETVRTALQKTRLRPEHLEIELTESAVMMDPEDAINKMTSLRGMDVRIALDDFGTGYSSLSYLKRLPVTGLKIDQSFIRDLAFDPDDAAIVRAIVAVGHELMLEVTAEGVETAEQAEFLKTRGCNEVQGYYFARPVPADQMRALLERGTLPVV